MSTQQERRPGGTGAAFGRTDPKVNGDGYSEAAAQALQAFQEIVREYIQTGWAPVPFPIRKKGPRIPGWQNLRITEVDLRKYFNSIGNIGIVLGAASDGLVDVDLDCQEAIDLAPKLLPKTNAIFGRASRLHSHWLYYIDGPAPTIKLKDPLNGKMLVELRGDGGQQTVFPGSTHESGESIQWAEDGDPVVVAYPVLVKAAKVLAAGCLIRRYLPGVTDYRDLVTALDKCDSRLADRIREWLQTKCDPVIREGSFGSFDPGRPPPYLQKSIGPRVADVLSSSLRITEAPTFWSEPIAEACAQMRALRDNAANQGRDSWWRCLGVLAYCEDGDRFAHDWSSKHAKYTFEETQCELDWWRRKVDGATRCETFDRKNPGICDRCPHLGKINSPISLGMRWPAQGAAMAAPCRMSSSSSSSEGYTESEKRNLGTTNSSPDTESSKRFGIFRGDELLSTTAPTRRWFVERFVPAEETTMLGGDGGTGKTTLGLQLSVASISISGQDWLGLKVNSCNVLYVSAEDPKNEIHFRLEQITRHLNLSDEELARFKLIDLAGKDATIAVFDRNGRITLTPLFSQMENAARDHNAGCVIFDSIADFFGGNENERREVRAFVGQLRGLAMRLHAAVIFLAHPSVDGIKTGRGYSGSTHWNNAVRSRLYFTEPPKGDSGPPPNPDLRMIELAKSNRARRGEKIHMIWTDGRFVPLSPGAGQNLKNETEAEELFLQLLSKATKQGMHVSLNHSNSYAPTKLAKLPGSKGIGKAALEGAMHRLIEKGEIRNEAYGPPSKVRHRLVIETNAPGPGGQ